MQQTHSAPLLSQHTPSTLYPSETGSEDRYDFDAEERTAAVQANVLRRQDIGGRREDALSARFVLEEAGWRYFALLAFELEGLRGLFTEQELNVILNTTSSPVWQWRPGMTLACVVADDQGIEDLNADTPTASLVRKLAALTPVQDVALVDVCEQVWRRSGDGPCSIAQVAEDCGLKLA